MRSGVLRRIAPWLVASLFVAGPAPAQPSSPSALIAELPFLDVGDPSAIVIDVAPETAARRLPLLLDTGATNSVMTPRLARSLGVNVRRHRSTAYRRGTRLGRDLRFWVETRRGDTAAETGFEYGLLGGSFLSHFVLEIDYAARLVRFFDPDLVTVPESEASPDTCVIPLRFVANRPHLALEIGDEKVQVLLDTGAFSGLMLGKREAERAGVAARPVPGLSAIGVRGPITLELGSADRVTLGAFTLRDQPVLVAPRGLYQQAGDTDSVLGHDVLSLHRVRIDYPRRRLLLERQAPPGARLLGESWQGIRASGVGLGLAEDVAVVRFVLPGGAGARMGIQPEDLIRLEGTSPAALHQTIAAGKSVAVERVDAHGREVEQVLGGRTTPP